MNTTDQRPSAAPRKPVLLALTAAVLVAHALLLFGPPSLSRTGRMSAERDAGASAPAKPGTEMAENGPTSAANAAETPSILHSQVRWIAPTVEPTRPDTAVTASAPAQDAVETPRTEPKAARTDNAEATPAVVETPTPGEADTTIPPSEAPALEVATQQAPPAANEAPTAQGSADITSSGSAGQGEPDHTPLAPASTVRDTELTYDVEGLIKGIPFHARGVLQWRKRDDRYEARMEISAFLIGSRIQTSAGTIGPSGLKPDRFSDRARSEKAAHFDHATGRIRFSNNARDTRMLAGAQDRLSVFMQLAALLEARPQAYPAGTKIELQVAGTGSADVWSFAVESAAEPLNLPAGELPAIRLYRAPRLEYDNALEVWLAPQLHHFPVRIRITQKNGDVADQQLNFVPKVEVSR